MSIIRNKGFTLIELLVVIGIIGILAAIVLVAVNPGRQFAQARDTQRQSDLYALTNAIYEYAAEHNGNLPGTDDSISVTNFPTTPTCIGTGGGCWDLASAGYPDGNSDGLDETIVPTYIAAIPFDPSVGSEADTNYTIYLDESQGGRVVATAAGELQGVITVTR